jgi:Fic family protein
MKAPQPAPAWDLDFLRTVNLVEVMSVGSTQGRKYLGWDELLHRTPPHGLTHLQWWVGISVARNASKRETPLVDELDRPFAFVLTDEALEHLHKIDQQAAGHLAGSTDIATPAHRDRYLVSSLVEEAITSSQLEGASTTRRVAKALLRSGRAPRTKSEQMIVNNFRTMERVRELSNASLTPSLLLDLHRMLTEETLAPTDVGRFQTPGEERVAVVWEDGRVLHQPPPAKLLENRIEALCAFANGDDSAPFMHPVIRAITLHFWLAYDHPFADGNGRVARTLFYWSMIKSGYWLTEFLSISSILRKAPAQYAVSFLKTETYDNDLTYFLLYQLEVVQRAIEAMHQYLARKTREANAIESMMKSAQAFNHRQLALLSHALRNPGATYDFASHQTSHNVVYQSARTDLLDLARRGLLQQGREGRRFVFTVPADLDKRMAGLKA